MLSKPRIARWASSKHNWLALLAGISIFVWGLSGLTHVALVLFGPQQTQFMPPSSRLDLQDDRPIDEILKEAKIDKAVAVRTVASAGGNLLQITTDPMQPRRYFVPVSGAELRGQDRAQAEFLARYYLDEGRPIDSARLQTRFDDEYPWVNRLLPVWRIRFAGDDELTAFVHTETSSLAAVNNSTKAWLQNIFRYLHTWEWVPQSMEWLRVAVIALMVGSLLAMALTGIAMLVVIRRKKRLKGARGIHRLGGYVLALPMLMFSISGLYHLFQAAIEPGASNLRMAEPLDLRGDRFPITSQWADVTRGLQVASLSLVEGEKGRPLYRFGLATPGAAPMAEHDHSGGHKPAMPTTAQEIRNARFAGVQPTGPALYIDARTGAVAPQGDREIARMIANRFLDAPDASITGMQLVTRFGVDYDFRNKRLPVWRVDYGAPYDTSLFVDTATATLVDRLDEWQKPERYVFSFIHKWNFMFPFGRMAANYAAGAAAIFLLLFMGVIGLQLTLRRRRPARAG